MKFLRNLNYCFNTLKIPAIDNVKLDVYERTKNSLTSMINAINAPVDILIKTKIILSIENCGMSENTSINLLPTIQEKGKKKNVIFNKNK